jgi:hypothetical protein
MFAGKRALAVAGAVTLGVLGAGVGSAAQSPASSTTIQTSVGQPASAGLVAQHDVDMSQAPKASAAEQQASPAVRPFLAGGPGYAADKAAAARSSNAPRASGIQSPPAGSGISTAGANRNFQGMSDSTAICPPFSCAPPDQALAASPSWVFQGVNTSYAVYNTSGVLQLGWPKNARVLHGVPAPQPAGCATVPFLSDPRAFYDPNDGRFWAAILEVEGAAGINPRCNFVSRYWIAVSATGDPRGLWHSYVFEMSLGRGTIADYTQFGFDPQAIYFSANMYNAAGTAFQYAEYFAANKSRMEQGLGVGMVGFVGPSAGGHFLQTVQPVESQVHGQGPLAEVFVASFARQEGGDPFGNDCVIRACHGLVLITIAHPNGAIGVSIAFVDTRPYITPPNADEPGCTRCIETLDTRISGTPVYRNGLVSFALGTGVFNGSQVVPGIFWGQVAVQLNDGGGLTGLSILQSGYYNYGGDSAASFGALMPDGEGNLFMLFEFMNSGANPGVAYTSRRVTQAPGSFHDGGIYLRSGAGRYTGFRWGDYEATSYDGFATDQVWFSGEYSTASGDWSTEIGRDQYSVCCS